jgi:hypothetical protein
VGADSVVKRKVRRRESEVQGALGLDLDGVGAHRREAILVRLPRGLSVFERGHPFMSTDARPFGFQPPCS